MKLETIAQLLGFVAMGVGFLIFQQSSRKRILLLKLICDVLWVTHFAMIGAYSGMAISCIGCFREIVFAFRKEDSKKSNLWLAVFLALGIGSVVLTWKNMWCICSMISTVLSTVAYWQTKSNRIKCLLFLVSISQLVYAISSHSYAAIANEIIAMLSVLIYFIRRYVEHKRSVNLT